MSKVCAHCTISGRVQGVFFRAGTIETASRLNVTGWVKNTDEGEVEVLVCGPYDEVEKMHRWLEKGPERSRVDEVLIEYLSYDEYGKEYTEFQII